MITELFAPVPLSLACRRDLSPAAKLLAGLLKYHARSDGEARVSHEVLQSETAIPPRSLVRALKELEAQGVIRATRFSTRGRGRVNSYSFVDNGAAVAPIAGEKRCQVSGEKVPNRAGNSAPVAHGKNVEMKRTAPGAPSRAPARRAEPPASPEILELNKRRRHEMAMALKSGGASACQALGEKWDAESSKAAPEAVAGL